MPSVSFHATFALNAAGCFDHWKITSASQMALKFRIGVNL